MYLDVHEQFNPFYPWIKVCW